jgi:hypothetical protein
MNLIKYYLSIFFEIIYQSWEWLFVFTVAFFISTLEHGGLISGVLFFTSSVCRIIFAKKISSFLVNFNDKKLFKYSIILRLILCFFSLLIYLFNFVSYYLIIFWMFITSFIYIVDGYAVTNFRYIWNADGKLNFSKISSFLNIGKRGGIALVSIVAFYLEKGNWGVLALLVFFLFLCGLFSSIIMFYSLNDNIEKYTNSVRGSSEIKILSVKKFAALMLMLNLFFGAGSLLIIRIFESYKISIFNTNILTIFYISFIAVNLISITYSRLFEKFSSLKLIHLSYLLVSILSIGYYFFVGFPKVFSILVLLFGGIYAIQTIFIFNEISKLIFGENSIKYKADIDFMGKVGFILSNVLTGLFLDYGFKAESLFLFYGFLAILCFTLYYIYFGVRENGCSEG